MRKLLKRLYRTKESLNIEEAHEMLLNNENVILLDVRSHQEYEEGHLPNAINVPTYELYEKIENIIKDKNSIIICYCTIGVRSKKAVKMLKKLGYLNIYHIDDEIKNIVNFSKKQL